MIWLCWRGVSPRLIQTLICRFPIKIGQHRRQHFDGFVGIYDLARLCIERSRLDVGREDFAVAVENIRA